MTYSYMMSEEKEFIARPRAYSEAEFNSGTWDIFRRTQPLLRKWRMERYYPLRNLRVSFCVTVIGGLVDRVLGYRSGGSGSIPGTTKKK
jgi:hypothetical protein